MLIKWRSLLTYHIVVSHLCDFTDCRCRNSCPGWFFYSLFSLRILSYIFISYICDLTEGAPVDSSEAVPIPPTLLCCWCFNSNNGVQPYGYENGLENWNGQFTSSNDSELAIWNSSFAYRLGVLVNYCHLCRSKFMTYHIPHTNCSIACASILHPSHVDIPHQCTTNYTASASPLPSPHCCQF